MKTLYVSDLDGTLLRGDATLSEHTKRVINERMENGMLFTYATARSRFTSAKVTKELRIAIPIIVYNGILILQNGSFEILEKNTFGCEKEQILDTLLSNGVYPIVNAFVGGREKFSYLAHQCNDATKAFVASRRDDARRNPVASAAELGRGEVFYFSCIGEYEKLAPLYEQLRERHHCIFHRDVYSREPWLEITPGKASKASAVLWLKEYLGADRVVVFGDGKNDLEMFAAADEAYAVENAVEELKAAATGVIESNAADGVAKWLCERPAV